MAAGATLFSVFPRHVLGRVPPSEKVNLALVGGGGRAAHDAMLADWWEVDLECRARDNPEYELLAGKWDPKKGYQNRRGSESMVNIVAVADVDEVKLKQTLDPNNKVYPPGDRFAKAKIYKDYRVMLDEMRNDIDGVIVAVPDHSHFHASMMAMKLGLNVFTEKPLVRYVAQARRLAEEARKSKVVTQAGNQGQSGWSTARIRDWMLEDAIGEVREVIAWNGASARATGRKEVPIPATLDYDLWLNRAPQRPYLGGSWRAWSYYGTGTLGDFGLHSLSASFYSLNFTGPERVEAEPGGEWPEPDSYPSEVTYTWYMPARGDMPPVRVRYFLMSPQRLAEKVAPLLRDLPASGLKSLFHRDDQFASSTAGLGAAIIGEKATIVHGGWGGEGHIIPEERAKEIGYATVRSPRVDGHMRSWLRAIKGREKTLSPFEYCGPLAEMVQLGDVALRSKDKRIDWDYKAMTVTNDKEANQFVHGPDPRPGWRI